MEEKKPWWKKILERLGIIKEEVPMIEENNFKNIEELSNIEEVLKEEKINKEPDNFNDKLKVVPKPKELTKEEQVFEILKERGIDSRLLENPRFKEDIMKQIKDIAQMDRPDEELTVEAARSIAMFRLDVDKGVVSYKDERGEGSQRNIHKVVYCMDGPYGDKYCKSDMHNFVPTQEGKEAISIVSTSTYDKEGIEIKREDKEGKFSDYSIYDGTIYGNIYQETLTRERQGVDAMFCTYEKAGVTQYGSHGLGFTMTLDNRYPENLYIADVVLQPLKNAKSIEEVTQARDGINQSALFYDDDKKAQRVEYQERFARGIESSKYSKPLTAMASKQPEYAKLLEQDKDM